MSFSTGFSQTFLYSFEKKTKKTHLFIYRMTLNASFYLSKIWDPNYRISFEHIKTKEVNYCQNVVLKIIPDNSELLLSSNCFSFFFKIRKALLIRRCFPIMQHQKLIMNNNELA